jgi:N-glycosidase YbiA
MQVRDWNEPPIIPRDGCILYFARDRASFGFLSHFFHSPIVLDAPRRVSQQSWFRKRMMRPRADWAAAKLDIMRRADWEKFTQNLRLGELLVATGTATLVEDSPFEPFWGRE